MKENLKKEFKGLVKENPYGEWDDVDKGLYIGGADSNINNESIESIMRSYIGKKVKLTIEEIEKEYLNDNVIKNNKDSFVR